MSKYDQIVPKECPHCGSIDSLQEVQMVVAVQPFSVDKPTKYSDIYAWEVSEADWESSIPEYIECSECDAIVIDFREEGK
jgi:hypothetical protein